MNLHWTNSNKIWAPLDRGLMVLLLLILGISVMIQYSASDMNMQNVIHHAGRIGIGLLALLLIAHLPLHQIRNVTIPLFLVNLVLVALVLVIGTESGGANRWLRVGPLTLQPSEFLKLTVPMVLALIVTHPGTGHSFARVCVALALLFGCSALVALQPDLGTAILIAVIGLSVIFLSGVPKSWIIAVITLGGISVPLLWKYFLLEYQKERIRIFFNPESDPLGHGYNIIQSKIAIGSGGVYGKGWTESTQAQFDFLPEHTTDFIFSIYAEEFGLIGVSSLMFLYLLVLLRLLMLSRTCTEPFLRLLIGGVSISFLLHIFINISMTIGYTPVVGLPLPLMSYGGSAMLTFLLGFGLVLAAQHSSLKAQR